MGKQLNEYKEILGHNWSVWESVILARYCPSVSEDILSRVFEKDYEIDLGCLRGNHYEKEG